MIAVDTNILVYAHRPDSPWHAPAKDRLRELAEGGRNWAIPWHCVHEFLGTVTHRRIYSPPTAIADAVRQVELWKKSPTLHLLGETTGYWAVLSDLLVGARVTGARVHDARTAALCIHHRVAELWTADRDFSSFPGLLARNPLIPGRTN